MLHHGAARIPFPVVHHGPKIMLKIKGLSLSLEKSGLTGQRNLLYHFFFFLEDANDAKYEILPRSFPQ